MTQAASLRQREFTVPSPMLLALYAVLPLSLLVVALDIGFFSYALRDFLPQNPGELIFWAIIFNFPHIISSLVTLADDEYIPYYKKRFSKALIIIVVGVLFINVAVPLLAPDPVALGLYGLFFLFFASYTIYHVLSQQFGIGMMLMKAKPGSSTYQAWRLTATVAATSMYMLVFARPNFESVQFDGFSLYDATLILAAIFVAVSSVIGFLLTRQSKRTLGTMYVFSNIFMLLTTLLFSFLDYGFFVILIPRAIHDLTAFMIYSVHDHNRNREVKHNYFYRFLAFIPIPPILLCFVLAIVLANSIECGAYLLDFGLGFDPGANSECALTHAYKPTVDAALPTSMQIGLQIMFICGFFHYYIESFVWKRESIHRHSVRFS